MKQPLLYNLLPILEMQAFFDKSTFQEVLVDEALAEKSEIVTALLHEGLGYEEQCAHTYEKADLVCAELVRNLLAEAPIEANWVQKVQHRHSSALGQS